MELNIPTLAGIGAMIGGATATLGKVFLVSKKTCANTSGQILKKLDDIEEKREIGQEKYYEEMKKIASFMGKVEQYMKNGNK